MLPRSSNPLTVVHFFDHVIVFDDQVYKCDVLSPEGSLIARFFCPQIQSWTCISLHEIFEVEMAIASAADFFLLFGDGLIQGYVSKPSLLTLQMRRPKAETGNKTWSLKIAEISKEPRTCDIQSTAEPPSRHHQVACRIVAVGKQRLCLCTFGVFCQCLLATRVGRNAVLSQIAPGRFDWSIVKPSHLMAS